MSLIKEIRENKWGIILGGIWGLAQTILPQILPKGILTTSWFLQLVFSLIRDIILLPSRIAIHVLSLQNPGRELWGLFLSFFLLTMISGMAIGYLMSKIIKKVIK